MTRRRSIKLVPAAMAIPLAALVVAGCGGGGGGSGATAATPAAPATAATTPAARTATVGVANKAALGKVLVDSSGHTLYLFEADKGRMSACTGACATEWPPLTAGGKPVAGSGVDAAKLSTARRSDGSRQVVYNGHPVYRFEGDQSSGDAKGQGLSDFGGLWYAVSPAGSATTKTAASGGSNSGY
jgi:predicted lipoprotein with Yx(FWY)xxD motif